MPELKFVLKAFVITLILAILLQIKIGQNTLETNAHEWLQTSSLTNFVREASGGAVLAIKNTAQLTTNFVTKTFGHDGSTQRASRMSIDLKRSNRYQDDHPDKKDQ